MSNQRKIFNVKTILAKQYHTLNLGEDYNALMGQPEARFISIVYGPSGMGKSVFVFKFANYFAENIGKVLYNSHEERANKTVQDRIKAHETFSRRLYFGSALTFDEMVGKIKRNHYKLVIIDSVQYMRFTYEQLKELRAIFSRRDLSIIMVSFGTTLGKTDGVNNLLHASDIKLYFNKGNMKAISRYLDKPVDRRLFSIKSPQNALAL